MDNSQISYRAEDYRDLFKNYSFRFEGLAPEVEEDFKKVVEDLGGEVRNNAPFSLVEKKYFLKITNTDNTDFYDITYIWNCIEAKKALDISSYRILYDDLECEKCGHRMKVKRMKLNTEKTSKEVLNFSQKALDDVKIKEVCTQPIQANIEKGYNEIDENSIENENFSISNEEENASLNIKQERISSQSTNRLDNTSKWIDTKSISIQSNIKQKDQDHSSQESSVCDISYDSDEDRKPGDCWWITKDIDENEKCKHPNCTFTPGSHQRHPVPSRMMTEFEKKILLKYLIDTDSIEKAKGTKLWQQMHADGYLMHRSEETLRNCIRRTILPAITSYNLPLDLLERFLELDEIKPKGRKR